jgi:hypothetical protein
MEGLEERALLEALCVSGDREEAVMRVSLDWWAVLAAALAVVLIKTGLVPRIPW